MRFEDSFSIAIRRIAVGSLVLWSCPGDGNLMTTSFVGPPISISIDAVSVSLGRASDKSSGDAPRYSADRSPAPAVCHGAADDRACPRADCSSLLRRRAGGQPRDHGNYCHCFFKHCSPLARYSWCRIVHRVGTLTHDRDQCSAALEWDLRLIVTNHLFALSRWLKAGRISLRSPSQTIYLVRYRTYLPYAGIVLYLKIGDANTPKG